MQLAFYRPQKGQSEVAFLGKEPHSEEMWRLRQHLLLSPSDGSRVSFSRSPPPQVYVHAGIFPSSWGIHVSPQTRQFRLPNQWHWRPGCWAPSLQWPQGPGGRWALPVARVTALLLAYAAQTGCSQNILLGNLLGGVQHYHSTKHHRTQAVTEPFKQFPQLLFWGKNGLRQNILSFQEDKSSF